MHKRSKPINNAQGRFKNSPVAVTILQRGTFVSLHVVKFGMLPGLYGLRVAVEEKSLAVVRGRWIPISNPLIDFHPSIPRHMDRLILARNACLTNDRLELLDIGEMQLPLV